MIKFADLSAELKRNAIGYLEKIISQEKIYDIALSPDVDVDGDDVDDLYEDDLWEMYTDDGHYTLYRLYRVYKDDEGIFATGVEDWDNDTMEFNILNMDVELLCGLVDKISEKYDN